MSVRGCKDPCDLTALAPSLQAMGDSEKQGMMRGQKTLEINPYHPLIQELKAKVRSSSPPGGLIYR